MNIVKDLVTIRLCNYNFPFHKKYLDLSPKLAELVENKAKLNITPRTMNNVITWGRLRLNNQSDKNFFNSLNECEILDLVDASRILDIMVLNLECNHAILLSQFRPSTDLERFLHSTMIKEKNKDREVLEDRMIKEAKEYNKERAKGDEEKEIPNIPNQKNTLFIIRDNLMKDISKIEKRLYVLQVNLSVINDKIDELEK